LSDDNPERLLEDTWACPSARKVFFRFVCNVKKYKGKLLSEFYMRLTVFRLKVVVGKTAPKKLRWVVLEDSKKKAYGEWEFCKQACNSAE
jgi:hypothetical protein